MFWKRIAKIEDLLESFKQGTDKRLDAIEKVLIKQEVNLEKHMERSEHLETIIEKMEDTDLKPLRRHVSMMEGALKLIGIIGILIGIAVSVFKISALV